MISELHKIKNPFSLFRERVANFPIERTLWIDVYRVNYVYQKMETQGNIAYIWENEIIMILERAFRFSSGKRLQNHDFAVTLIPGRKTDVGNTMLRQRCDNAIRRRGKKTTKTKALKNFESLTKKTTVLEPYFKKVEGLRACNFIEKRN